MKQLLLLALIPLTLISAGSFAQTEPGENAVRPRTSGLLFLPILYYTPETRIAAGALLNYYYRHEGSDTNSRLSTIVPALIYTQNKQILGELSGDLYWAEEMYHLNGYLGYAWFPNKFYGIGNDSRMDDEEPLTSRLYRLRLNLQRKIYPDISIGPKLELEQMTITERTVDGLLASGLIAGSEGGRASGVGIAAQLDSRDNPFAPLRGEYYQVSLVLFRQMLTSDYTFTRSDVDLRQYFALFTSDVVALQAYGSFIVGNPPFNMLSQLGGQNVMRGYYDGRFRDKNAIALQAEYRRPLWWRFNLAGFIGFGEVADNADHFSFGGLRTSYGGGLRYALNPEERLSIRLDFGVSRESSGLYITIGEAF